MRISACLSVAALLSGTAFGESSLPTFEIADVHTVPFAQFQFMRGGLARGGRYELRTATMVELITAAYGVDPDNVLGGPSWLESDRYDIIAKAAPGTSGENAKLMLQALLADRFKLVLHNDTKPLPAFVLTVAKGGHPKFKEAAGGSEKGCQGQPGQNLPPGTNLVTCHNQTLTEFAENLHQMAGAYLTSPVVDSTGLKGNWDFDLRWTGKGALTAAGSEGLTVFDAVEKQLGLKLEFQKIPMPVIVVDSANQKPTDNLPGATKALPPTPTEFEVADIKPSGPDSRQTRSPFQPGGKIEVRGMTLKNLINIAWNINSDELLAGGPKWLDSDKFDIIAKATTATLVSTPSNAPPVDIDALRLMLRALIIDRFKLATHFEDRPVTAYTLTAVKPKLTKADPMSRTRFKEGPAPGAKDPREKNPALARLVTCQNMTMTQLAEQLPNMASGYLRTPVQDLTGLEGGWDFTLSFTPLGALQGGGRGRGGDGPPAPSAATEATDAPVTISLFEAVEKQLGLKLEMKKRPLAVLVIDHVEQKPTEN